MGIKIGNSNLVIGGGNSAADIVAALSRAKRTAEDDTTIYWANRRERFKVKKEVARDLGEEIFLGGNIRILPGAVPRVGELDEDGTLQRKKHTDLIYTAIRDGIQAMEDIGGRNR